MRISATPNVYTTQNKNQQAPVQFGGISKTLTENKAYKAIESKVIEGCAKLVNTKTMENLVEKTKKHPWIEKNLNSHLIVLGSTILSGFYILKTLGNKDLDEQKRKTLAINQGLTYGVSTAMAYVFDGWAIGKFKTFTTNFIKANTPKNGLNLEKLQPKLAKWESGLEIARPIIAIDLVYRFIAPVMVTPIANWCGNKLREHKQAHKN